MVKPKAKRNGGWTLLELLISLGLTGALLASLGTSLRRSLSVYEATSRDLALERRFERAVTMLSREFPNAARTTLTPLPIQVPGSPTAWMDRVEFRAVAGWNAGSPSLGGLIRVETRLEAGETEDGTDEDGDGLVDERELVITKDADTTQPRSYVLARGVPRWYPGESPDGSDENGNGLVDEPGFTIVIEDELLTFRLALRTVAPGGMVRTRTRSVQVLLGN